MFEQVHFLNTAQISAEGLLQNKHIQVGSNIMQSINTRKINILRFAYYKKYETRVILSVPIY